MPFAPTTHARDTAGGEKPRVRPSGKTAQLRGSTKLSGERGPHNFDEWMVGRCFGGCKLASAPGDLRLRTRSADDLFKRGFRPCYALTNPNPDATLEAEPVRDLARPLPRLVPGSTTSRYPFRQTLGASEEPPLRTELNPTNSSR